MEESTDQCSGTENASGKPQDERMETDTQVGQEMEVDQPEETHFVLAPTPAQLGKAPLQRRLASSCSQDSSKDLSPTEEPLTSTHTFTGILSVAAAPVIEEVPPTSAHTKKKQFFKKAKNDDMDT